SFENSPILDTDAKVLEASLVSYEHLDELETSNRSSSCLEDLMDVSLEEDTHLRNLRIKEWQEDSDFEKQISPLLSDDDA
ncbi:hypothetical protein NPIL_685291, partial [Nephila pilipes]